MTEEIGLVGEDGQGQRVISRLIEDEMRESFIDYSMSVICLLYTSDAADE